MTTKFEIMRSRSTSCHVVGDYTDSNSRSNPRPTSGSYSFCPYRPAWGDASNLSVDDCVENSDDLSLSDLAFSMDMEDDMEYLNSIVSCDTAKSITSHLRPAMDW